MMKPCTDKDGKRRLCCDNCGYVSTPTATIPEKFHCRCETADSSPDAQLRMLLDGSGIDHKDATSSMLAGDIVASVTALFGIPPCGNCERRRKWMNRTHQWIRDRLMGSR